MRSLESLIYDILVKQNNINEDIGVQGTDKPTGPQGGFSGSFSSRHPNSTINRKRKAAQQKNAAPLASFESGSSKKNNITPVPNVGDAPSVAELSARGASESGKYKSIRTKLKEIREQTTPDNKKSGDDKKIPNIDLPTNPLPYLFSDDEWKKLNAPNPSYNPLKPWIELYHDKMAKSSADEDKSKKDQPPVQSSGTTNSIDDKSKSALDKTIDRSKHMLHNPAFWSTISPLLMPGSSGIAGKIAGGATGAAGAMKQLPAPLKQLPPPQTKPVEPQAAPETSPPSQPTSSGVKPASQSQSQELPGVTVKTKEKTDFPNIELKKETPENVPAVKPQVKPEEQPTRLEPKPGNPGPETERQTLQPKPEEQPNTKETQKPSTETNPELKQKTESPTKEKIIPPNVPGKGPLLKGIAGGGMAGGLLGWGLGNFGLGHKPNVQPAGFIHPEQSAISGFSFSPLGMAASTAQSSAGANKSHILARLKMLLPAEKEAEKAGKDTTNVTEEKNKIFQQEEKMNKNYDKERREVENVDRKEFLRNRKGTKASNPRSEFLSKSTLSRNGAIKTRIIDDSIEITRNNIIREAISDAIKKKKTEKMTVGSEKTSIDLHPVLNNPPENRAS